MKRSNILTAIAVVIILVAAVGYYASTSLLQQPQPMQPEPKPEPKLTKVKFLISWTPWAAYAPFYLAVEKGWFREVGLDVEIVPGQGSAYSARLVASGQVEFASCAASNVISAMVKGSPLKVVYMMHQNDPNTWFALRNSGIKSPQDWVGKRVGVQAESSGYIVYQALLKKLGIDRNKIQELPQGFDSVSALATNQLDVGTNYRDAISNYNSKGYSDIVIMSAVDYGVNPYSNGVIARPDYISKNPEVVRKFVQVTKKAWEFAWDHPGEAVDALVRASPQVAVTRVLQLDKFEVSRPLWTSDTTKKYGFGYMDEDRWRQTVDLLYEYGMISSKPDIKELYTNAFLS